MKRTVSPFFGLFAAGMSVFLDACGSSAKGEPVSFPQIASFKENNRTFNTELVVSNTSEYFFDVSDFSQRALKMLEKFQVMFYVPDGRSGGGTVRGGYFARYGDTAFNWAFGATHTATLNTHKANPSDTKTLDFLAKLCSDLSIYMVDRQVVLPSEMWGVQGKAFTQAERDLNKAMLKPDSMGRILVKYANASVYNSGDGYYDDNIWCVMALLESGLLLGNYPGYEAVAAKAIADSEALMTFCISGWDEVFGGGIYWHESKKSKNTCINGPFGMAASMFYEYYSDLNKRSPSAENQNKMAFYLQWAKVVYEWTYSFLRDNSDGTYLDNVSLDTGKIQDWKFTYNCGTMISTGARLYAITGDEIYKERALQDSLGAYWKFMKRLSANPDGSDRIDSNDPWFNVYLIQGYLDVAALLDEHRYIQRMAGTLEYAWHNARDYYGFVLKRWDGSDRSDDNLFAAVDTLNAAGDIESFALVGIYYNEYYRQLSDSTVSEPYVSSLPGGA